MAALLGSRGAAEMSVFQAAEGGKGDETVKAGVGAQAHIGAGWTTRRGGGEIGGDAGDGGGHEEGGGGHGGVGHGSAAPIEEPLAERRGVGGERDHRAGEIISAARAVDHGEGMRKRAAGSATQAESGIQRDLDIGGRDGAIPIEVFGSGRRAQGLLEELRDGERARGGLSAGGGSQDEDRRAEAGRHGHQNNAGLRRQNANES